MYKYVLCVYVVDVVKVVEIVKQSEEQKCVNIGHVVCKGFNVTKDKNLSNHF